MGLLIQHFIFVVVVFAVVVVRVVFVYFLPSPFCIVFVLGLLLASMGIGSFPGVRCGRGVTLTPHPLLVLRSKIE